MRDIDRTKISTFEKCVFCESHHETFGNTPEFKRLIGDKTNDRILFETKNFVVVPSVGQIVEGYLLIMPKKHYISISNLDYELFDELEAVYSETRDILEKNYSKPIFFEHGVCRAEYYFNGCCVDHAHIHAVPAPVNVSESLKNEFRYTKIEKVSDLGQIARDKNYLFVDDFSRNMYAYEANEVRSQHIRYLIADLLGVPEKGDWTLYPGEKEMIATINKLSYWRKQKLRDEMLIVSKHGEM